MGSAEWIQRDQLNPQTKSPRPLNQNETICMSSTFAACGSGLRPDGNSKLHSGVNDQHEHNHSNGQRDHCHRAIWWNCVHLLRYKRHSVWRDQRSDNDLLSHGSDCRLPSGDCLSTSRSNRNRINYKDNCYRLRNKFAFGVLAVSLAGAPVLAEEPGTTAIANPVATSTGSVNNQAVQINQGGFSRQSFGPGHSCNSSTLTFTPFYLGNETFPTYNRNQNFGAQVSFSVPLNRSMVNLCVELAKKKLEKERLDMAFVRFRECAKLYGMGYKIREDSPFAIACEDIVPLNAVVPTTLEVLPYQNQEP